MKKGGSAADVRVDVEQGRVLIGEDDVNLHTLVRLAKDRRLRGLTFRTAR